MRKSFAVAFAAMLALSPITALAGPQDFVAQGYVLPADKAVSVVLMRPDVNVGELQAGGLPQPNADWTRAARENLIAAFRDELGKRKIAFHVMDDALTQQRAAADAASQACTAPASTTGTPPPSTAAPASCAAPPETSADDIAAQYTALHAAVVTSILAHKYGIGGGGKLPTKKDDFQFTMGPGAAQLGKIGGGNYGLFVETFDQFASDSRKAMQVAGMLGCMVGFCVIVHGGIHDSYASLVDLDTGNVVWFNLVRGSQGDVRQAKGAEGLASAILASMPTRPGEAVKAAN